VIGQLLSPSLSAEDHIIAYRCVVSIRIGGRARLKVRCLCFDRLAPLLVQLGNAHLVLPSRSILELTDGASVSSSCWRRRSLPFAPMPVAFATRSSSPMVDFKLSHFPGTDRPETGNLCPSRRIDTPGAIVGAGKRQFLDGASYGRVIPFFRDIAR